MKVGTAMDFNEPRRGTRSRGFFFDPTKIELVEIDASEGEDTGITQEELEDSVTVVNPDEPEPDDPDAA